MNIELLRERFTLDPATGWLTWNERDLRGSRNARFAGRRAGAPKGNGYRVLSADEIEALTGYKQPGAQLSALKLQGFHRARRSITDNLDGTITVDRRGYQCRFWKSGHGGGDAIAYGLAHALLKSQPPVQGGE